MTMMMHPKPTVYIPQWSSYLDYCAAAEEESDDDISSSIDVYSSDEFRMYEFKIRRCVRGRAHDWTECPFAHPGEKARRRDPRKHYYSGTACPDFRKGACRRGDSCDMAHGVFECWLHPARYRTQPCKDGTACRRRVCFFAHTPDQLRVLSPQRSPKAVESYDGSPLRSPAADEVLVGALRRLQIEKVKPSSALGLRGGFCGLPIRGYEFEFVGEEMHEERVESGRALRAEMYEQLMSEEVPAAAGPDVGWVSELVK